MIDQRVASIAAEYGVRIIGKSRWPGPMETRAPETLSRIFRRHGEDHLRLVLSTLAETANNGICLDETGLWAASDMIRACKTIIDTDASAFLELFDATPVAELQVMTRGLSGIVHQRPALVGMLYERAYRRFNPNADQLDFLDDRRQIT